MRILSIESSCDETSIAIVDDGIEVKSNIIASSQAAFTTSGGVIPEEAARKQVECVIPVLHQALELAQTDWSSIDAIAVTKGPGLLGSLLVGTVTGRALASIHELPLIGVHHTLGHLSSTWLETDKNDPPTFPILTLSASGGHTELWLRTSHTQGELIGRTRDDAAGEAFDKGATLLGLPYPGGPSIAKAAEHGKTDAYDLPVPLQKYDTLDFSFSGLKTALRYTIRDLPPESRTLGGELLDDTLHNIAASYQYAICFHLVDRIRIAIERYPEIKEVHLVGGVSANTVLRSMVTEACGSQAVVRFPKKLSYCTDNAAMIAAAGYFLHLDGDSSTVGFETMASLPLAAAVTSY